MKTLASSLALSVLLLSAGAFANNGIPQAAKPASANVTVIMKNGASPVLPPAASSCELVRCINV
jgi:hypothetical protein